MIQIIELLGIVASFWGPVNLPGEAAKAQVDMMSPVGMKVPAAPRTQIFFKSPAGMHIHWLTQGKNGKDAYSAIPLETPGRFNFIRSATYQLKLAKIPGHPGRELYPTLEVVGANPATSEFLAHNSIPLEFTEDDFKQVIDGNYLVKVIYLPSAAFQDVAGGTPGEISSARLEAGQNPVQEALRRGSVLLVLRIGNIDQRVP